MQSTFYFWCLLSGEEWVREREREVNIYMHTCKIYQVVMDATKKKVAGKRNGNGFQGGPL